MNDSGHLANMEPSWLARETTAGRVMIFSSLHFSMSCMCSLVCCFCATVVNIYIYVHTYSVIYIQMVHLSSMRLVCELKKCTYILYTQLPTSGSDASRDLKAGLGIEYIPHVCSDSLGGRHNIQVHRTGCQQLAGR